ncbi:hypothetical protein B0T11DRAFT_271447 [Plectosphaerella cucumerina]|uniref:Wax synthase domain-containing protein n=1 Tax=Plectosphaerella cucumerina TaxID=40658 RepID=A0A8K0TVL0_9PEZI|nr:hypothetical protein B0T11DRAFT_271447 [Plectosphaerella cucumerina]
MTGPIWQPSELLAATLLETYRDMFKAALAEGTRRNFILPYDFIPSFFLPILYMAIPHTKRPWLYQARWLLLAFIVGFNVQTMARASSTNLAMSYAAGMYAFWSIMHNFALLVWMRPQFEAERVQRRKRQALTSTVNMEMSRGDTSGSQIPQDGSAVRREGQAVGNGVLNGHSGPGLNGSTIKENGHTTTQSEQTAPGANTAVYEYYWQPFPEHGTFLERLHWSLDLYATFRGAGWNWCVRVIPNPQAPVKPLSGELVRMDTIPLRTAGGYKTYPTTSAFLRAKLGAILFSILSLDFLKVLLMRDLFFIDGGGQSSPLPTHLAALPSWLVPFARHALFLWALYVAILFFLSVSDLAGFFALRYLFPMRDELWQYSSIFGSLSQVLDRGLAGFWGLWWHQTFRVPFAGPTGWLLRKGYLAPRTFKVKAAAMLFAFFQSGLLHGAGSWSSIPETKIWYPMVFFMLSGVGVVVQSATCAFFKAEFSRLPRAVRRTGNAVYVLLWLHLTVWPLLKDFTRLGVWLIEPVPVSIFRAMGFGQVENDVWRIDHDTWPHWVRGKYWWQSGFAL